SRPALHPCALHACRAPFAQHIVYGLIRLGEIASMRGFEASQCLTDGTMNLGETEGNALPAERPLEIDERFGAGQIDARHIAHEQNHEMRRGGSLLDESRDSIAH